MPHTQCSQGADHGPHAGAHVDNGRPHAHRRAAGLTRGAHYAAEGLHQWVVAGSVLERASLTEGAHVAVNQRGLHGQQAGGVELKLLDLTGTQVLHDDVGALKDQGEQRLAVLRRTQIGNHRVLVAVQGLEGGRGALPEGRPPFACVIAPGLFDLDDLCA